jgi:murein DD-endopeptidase MepM/ murein hydrolase activator NlpD
LSTKSKKTTDYFPHIKKLLSRKKFSGFKAVCAVFLFVFGIFAFPAHAHAFSITSFIKNLLGIGEAQSETHVDEQKPFPFLSASNASDPKADARATQLQFVDDTSLASAVGPLGNAAEAADSMTEYKISTYKVRKGDTLSEIAKSFGVSVNTITWANNIPKGAVVKEGTLLVILPVSGVQHTVVKGDTPASIAKKYGGDPNDIVDFNDLVSGEQLAVGSIVIVPDGEAAASATPTKPSSSGKSVPTYVRGGGPDIKGYYQQPVYGYKKTTGIHGFNGVDLAAPKGTPVYASAAGTIITARASGWNGGYGEYIAIAHPNGTQTLYAHLSVVGTTAGAVVAQGEEIGAIGNTGKSTGPHLHFEIRGAKNPF